MLLTSLLGASLETRLEALFLHLGSDWVPFILGSIATLIVVLICERIVYFWWTNDNTDSLRRKLGDALERHQLGRARELLRKRKSHAARLAHTALAALNRGPGAIEELVAAERLVAQLRLERGIAALHALGNSAWAVGLFALVVGLARAFSNGSDMALAGAAQALLILAAGLCVAFPTLIITHYIEQRARARLVHADAVVRVALAYSKTRR